MQNKKGYLVKADWIRVVRREKSDPLMLDQKTCGYYYYWSCIIDSRGSKFFFSLKPECAGCLFFCLKGIILYISIYISIYFASSFSMGWVAMGVGKDFVFIT
jgi:hypothetical protein